MGEGRISELVEGGIDDIRLVFGVDGEPVAASELAAEGTSLFSGGADAAAVGVLISNDRPSVTVVLGALLGGARLVSLPMPGRGADLVEYAAFLRAVCDEHEIHEVVCADEVAGLLDEAGVPARPHAALGSRPLAVPDPEGFGLVQFTSGSTRSPSPVGLSDRSLGANVAAILDVVRPEPGDALVSWLPLAHDMGLVGMLLTGLAGGGPDWTGGAEIVLLDPREFLRRPSVWIEALSRWKGTFTAAPDFAFRMAMERSAGGDLDLSMVRCAIVGGEIVRAGTLAGFTDAYRGRGFAGTALCPAYGMAEVGLAVTLTPPELSWRELAVDPVALADRQVCLFGERPSTPVVASGPPLPGYGVEVDAPDERAGRLSVRGPSLGIDPATGEALAGPEGWHATGDVGFVDDGWLFVCGRSDDWLVAHGRKIYAPTVEAAIGRLSGVRAGRVAAVGLPGGDWVVVAEPARRSRLDGSDAEALRRRIRTAAVDAGGARPDDVVVVASGELPLTSSGKLQRHRVRIRLLSGDRSHAATA